MGVLDEINNKVGVTSNLEQVGAMGAASQEQNNLQRPKYRRESVRESVFSLKG